MRTNLFIVFCFFISINIFAQFGSQDSGGKSIPEEACYDVKFYDINLTIDPADEVIGGFVTMKAEAVSDFRKIIVDLDNIYNIESVSDDSGKELSFKHENGKIIIDFPSIIKKGNLFKIKTTYSGKPRIAVNPPWDDGFIWKKSAEGFPWASVTCQGGGADIWWPCKDFPSDEPDSVSIHFTVPEKLVCISNGRFISTVKNNNNTETWNWFVSTPINNYCVTFYLGPYKSIEYDYTSTAGGKIPFTVWALPENFEKAKEHSPQFVNHMRVMEELIGPYPFRSDKYSVVEAPHLGMEHQTAIAYGFGWKNHDKFPFDWLHHHEFSHEWWGNMVTCASWNDFWIHEGTGTYMQPLYLEKMFGHESYIGYLNSIKRFSNKMPVAPRDTLTAGESYNLDIYYKGAWIIHTLRYYLGDEIFFKVLRRWAYPSPEMEKVTNGKQCRFATTDEFLKIAENISGKKLDWFFEVYLRNAELPILNVTRESDKIILQWKTENNLPFNLPVEIKVGDKIQRVEMNDNKAEINLPKDSESKIDLNEWILMDKINFTN
jgi:aminopeptidase N